MHDNYLIMAAQTLPGSIKKLSQSPGVLVAGFVLVFLQSGTFKACGVLFEDVVKQYNTTYLFGGWIFTFQPAFSFIVAGICGSVVTKMSNQIIGVIGGILFGLGFVLQGAVGQTLWHLFTFVGITALGGGALYFSAYMTFVEHFEESFSLAYSVRDVFLYLGITFMPPLLEYFLSSYGLQWTFLLLGAVDWNTIVSGLLLKQAKSSGHQGNTVQTDETSFGETSRESVDDENNENNPPCYLLPSFLSITPAVHHPVFVLFILLHSFISYNFVIWALFLVPYGLSLGYKPVVAVFLSTFGGIGGFFGKMAVIAVFYFNKMNLITAAVIPSTVYGIALTGYILSNSYIILVICSVLSGFTLGYVDASTSAMLPRYLCKRHLRQGLAMSYFYSGIFMQLGGIIAGAALDATSNFHLIFGMMFVLNIVVIVLAVAMENMDSTRNQHCSTLLNGTD